MRFLKIQVVDTGINEKEKFLSKHQLLAHSLEITTVNSIVCALQKFSISWLICIEMWV